ncbi:unnamed protein product [Rotaria magnacalcarata]|uniref:Pre-mRNA-splicing factor 38 n=1 Tax=Rotaria magnacalcarata TaxID=392030 RepID=A0A814FP12_9BILA|nr:unnamed protein product [Rotaria magnacalcarata]CAF1645232.1 unnamed protein product [Rotaria magnacalcarata]CAF1905618.1 unnamed protein product [Rotaria magnacalcarata]CAF2014116.1 unnamed protein product [Rotaria magnacalcarata]CAF2055955.1 unnamed protein product [Rotaria magnacalcarata]
MANRTVKEAPTIKGTNPQYLIEKIIRSRIYDSRYWKEDCFALTAELVVDKAVELKCIGGVCGANIRPAPFLCLVLKMLQICPEKDIIVEFIKNEEFKYVRALGAFYMRLVGTSVEIYKYLEPLYNDYRKMKYLNRNDKYELLYMDEFIDQLLREERVLEVQLPRLQRRNVLEENNQLEPRQSVLDEDIDDNESSAESEEEEKKPKKKETISEKPKKKWKDLDKPSRSPSPRYARSVSPREKSSKKRRRSRSRSRSKSRSPARDSRKKHSSRHEHRDKKDRSRDHDREKEKRRRD